MISLWTWLSIATAATCEPILPNGRRDPLAARAPALGQVMLEIPLFGDTQPPLELVTALNIHELKATLLVTQTWAEANGEFLEQAAHSGHEIGLWLSLSEDLKLSERAADPDLREWIAVMKRGRKAIRKQTRKPVFTIGLAMLPPAAEIAAEAMGFKAILPIERTLYDRPRRARAASTGNGRASNGQARIIGQGAYEDGCGHMLPHWSPAALDRATSVAARSIWTRIGLPPDPLSGSLLDRWAETVLIPHKWRVVTASEMAEMTKRPDALGDVRPPEIPIPKVIKIDEWRQAAAIIAASGNLPRRPTTNLNLTEAFYGLVMLNAASSQPTSVTLGRLDPPHETAPRGTSADQSVTKEDVRTAAQQLFPRLRGQMPALLTIGGQTVTAAQALQLFARAFLEEPTIISLVHDPDPYAPGGGWGQSKGR